MSSPSPSPEPTRLSMELDLLTAIYPDQITYNPISRELKYMQPPATLHLRLPDNYPISPLPSIIAATSLTKTDIRDQVKHEASQLHLPADDESLDALIALFEDILHRDPTPASSQDLSVPVPIPVPASVPASNPKDLSTKTIIIWLHHLLNTRKRKLALSPPCPLVNGVTKPGYPGIILYTGPAAPIDEHVARLKLQNWQAFQVRYEQEGETWELGVEGVRELETMSEVVGMVGGRKEVFLRAVGIK